MSRKKPFILLELLLAMALLSLFGTLVLQAPLLLFRREYEVVDQSELERIAEQTFAALQTELHQEKIPWDVIALNKKPNAKEPFRKDAVRCNLSGRTYQRSVYIWTKRKKEGLDGLEHRLLSIAISFSPAKKKRGFKKITCHYSVLLSIPSVSSRTAIVE